MNQQYLALLAAFVMLGGCATTDSLSDQMAGWQQDDVDAALAAWGDPEASIAFGDGRLLTWRDRAAVSTSLADAPVVCERMLAVDADGVITGWRWRGDACPTIDASRTRPAMLAAADLER
jgi:hypothetical protein